MKNWKHKLYIILANESNHGSFGFSLNICGYEPIWFSIGKTHIGIRFFGYGGKYIKK